MQEASIFSSSYKDILVLDALFRKKMANLILSSHTSAKQKKGCTFLLDKCQLENPLENSCMFFWNPHSIIYGEWKIAHRNHLLRDSKEATFSLSPFFKNVFTVRSECLKKIRRFFPLNFPSIRIIREHTLFLLNGKGLKKRGLS